MFSRIFTIAFFYITLFFIDVVYSQSLPQKIDAYLSEGYKKGVFNGIVLVARSDTVLFVKGYGLADIENKIPITVNTKFRIGSITKQFTTVMILQLVEEGKIRLDDKISTFLPDYRQDIGDRVTIDHLLKHMSGIPSYTSQEFWQNYSGNKYSEDEFIQRFLSGDLEFTPNSIYRYSNSNHYLLAVIIENVTRESYQVNLQKRITEPLSMYNTGSGFSDPTIQDLAKGYIKSLNKYIPEPYTNSSNVLGTGDIYSTALDFLAWNRAFKPGVILSDSIINMMFTPYHWINRFYGYGYAWYIYTIRLRDSDKLVWLSDYNGQFYGNYATITRVIENDYLIVIMSNMGKTPIISDEIVNILYGKPYLLNTPNP